ncbi:MAG: hypothetical protein CMP07_09295 [Xanthomonadales bacterium]|nr:hypothetical protein [Xanthomonadales bacterium]
MEVIIELTKYWQTRAYDYWNIPTPRDFGQHIVDTDMWWCMEPDFIRIRIIQNCIGSRHVELHPIIDIVGTNRAGRLADRRMQHGRKLQPRNTSMISFKE